MGRILYVSLPTPTVAGGLKIIFRHVEALRELGYDAAVAVRPGRVVPSWFESSAPVLDLEGPDGPKAGDIIVVPEDTRANLEDLSSGPARKVIFCQNHFYCIRGMGRVSPDILSRYEAVMACSRTVADWVSWRFPSHPVEVVPALVDDTLFGPATRKAPAIAYAPRKRRTEAEYLCDAFRHAYPQHAGFRWVYMDELPERTVAAVLRKAAILLSLSRLEGLGLLPLEAMASGCVVAGFTGGGGREYATAANGFWADDVDGVLKALGAAADLHTAGGREREAMIRSGYETAARWSRAAMVDALERFFAPRIAKTL